LTSRLAYVPYGHDIATIVASYGDCRRRGQAMSVIIQNIGVHWKLKIEKKENQDYVTVDVEHTIRLHL